MITLEQTKRDAQRIAQVAKQMGCFIYPSAPALTADQMYYRNRRGVKQPCIPGRMFHRYNSRAVCKFCGARNPKQ